MGSFWRRRLHPAGVAARVALSLGLAWALWRHAWPWVGGLAAALLAAPFWFPPAKRLDSFLARAMLGERVWLDQARAGAKVALLGGAALLHGALLWALVAGRAFPALVLLGAAAAFRAGFWLLVARLPRGDPDATEKTLGRTLADAGPVG
jgi:hypothetical protein